MEGVKGMEKSGSETGKESESKIERKECGAKGNQREIEGKSMGDNDRNRESGSERGRES